jgi:hypothetical protein
MDFTDLNLRLILEELDIEIKKIERKLTDEWWPVPSSDDGYHKGLKKAFSIIAERLEDD